MSDTDRSWDAVPSPDADRDGREARGASSTTADGRVHGRPAPQYGEYAPEGWVNPVLVEQERQEREAEARAAEQRRLEAARQAAATGRAPRGPQPTRPAGIEPPGRADEGTAGARRLGASPGDLLLTVVLFAFGLTSVVQQLAVGNVASTVAKTLEQRYTALADPQALVPAAIVSAIGGVVVLVLVAWWAVHRLRLGKRTFWVPLLGGVVASVLTTIAFMVVVMQDGQFMAWVMQHGGA
jgi:hypothetical protein